MQECLKIQHDLKVVTDQLSQQSDYCVSLGSACCTLLWRVSKQEDGIQAILAGVQIFCQDIKLINLHVLHNDSNMIHFLIYIYTTQRTKLPLLMSRYTTSCCSVLTAEVNRLSTCAKSNNHFYLFNLLLIMLESK